MATATKVRLRFRLATGKVIRPGFWIGDPTTNTAAVFANLQAIADATRTAVGTTNYMDNFTTGINFEEAEAQNYVRVASGRPPPAPAWEWEAQTIARESAGADIPGTRVVDTLPPQVSWVHTVYSVQPGPEGRNRHYGPPLGEDEVGSDGVIATARRTSLEADFGAIIGAAVGAAGAGVLLVAASAIHDDLYAFSHSRVQTKVRTQRPRLDL